jgi:hypothetical protein
MMRRRLGLVALAFLCGTPAFALARCGDDPGDAQALTDARGQVDADCDCAGAASHRDHVRCALGVARTRVDAGQLRSQCRGAVKRCAAKSTCGKPGAVSCCIPHDGSTRCRIARDTGSCTARGGSSGTCPSCCDASGGGCVPTTTTTLPPCGMTAPQCNGTCFGDDICVNSGGVCACHQVNFCTGGSYPTCDGTCPAGSTCFNSGPDCRCVPDDCMSNQCVCLPEGTVPLCQVFPNVCPAGLTCFFCNAISTSFCVGPPCANVGECPPDHACIDTSGCLN